MHRNRCHLGAVPGETLEPLREKLNKALKQKWEEWEIPREAFG